MDPRPPDPQTASLPTGAPAPFTGGETATGSPTGSAPAGVTAPDLSFLAPPQQPGEIGRLAHYRVLSLLGRGGMGVVFRAEDTQLKRAVALKVMLPHLAADPHARARFQREAEAQAKVDHDHVVTIFQVGVANGAPFLTMPLLKGQTLATALKQNPRPPVAEVARIGREIAEGLAAAHDEGLIHRDIKPGNVWLEGAKRRVKVLDFGLARAATPDATADEEPITGSGAVVGTPAFMAPEQARGEAVDARTDLFSLGAVLYQMATGKMPFTGASTFAVLSAVTGKEPPPVCEVAPEVPPALGALIARLLAKDPAARPQSAEEVADALREIELGLTLVPVRVIPLSAIPGADAGPDPWAAIDATEPDSAESARPPAKVRPVSRRALALWAGVALVALIGVGLIAAKLFKAAEPKGVLTVETDSAEWEIVVKRGGQVVRDRTRDREFVLPPGEYTVEPAEPIAGLKITPNRVALAKDGKERVWLSVDKPKPPKPKDPPPTPTPDRLAAEALKPHCAEMFVLLASGKTVALKPNDPLPSESFELIGIALVGPGPNQPPPDFASKVFVPQVSNLKTFQFVIDYHGTMPLMEDDLAKLAAAPVGAKLTGLGAEIALTPGALEVVKRFPRASGLRFNVSKADDALMGRLRELRITSLNLYGLDFARVGDQTASMLKGSDVTVLRLDMTKQVDRRAGKMLAEMPKLESLGLQEGNDEFAAGLSTSRALQSLYLGNETGQGTFSNAGLEHLKGLTTFRGLNIAGSQVTPAGAKKLAEALPLCKITYSYQPGGTIEPKPLIDVTRQCVAALLKSGASVAVADAGTNRDLKSADELRAEDRLSRLSFTARRGSLLLDDPAALAALRAFPAEPWHEHLRVIQFDGFGLENQVRAAVAAPGARVFRGWQFWNAPPPEGTFEALAALPDVGYLRLEKAGTTDAALKLVAKLPHLRELVVARSEVTGAGVAGLRGSPVTALLLPDNPGIDDTAVEHLAALPALKQLNLKGTKVTKAGVEKLGKALPLCKIEWDGGVIDPKAQPAVERKAAEALNPHVDLLLRLAPGKEVFVKRGDALPAEPFTLIGVNLQPGRAAPGEFVTVRLLPALEQTWGVERIQDDSGQLQWKAAEVARLAKMPTRLTLDHFDAFCTPTEDVIAALKQFPKLTYVQIHGAGATDADLTRLKELPALQSLSVTHLGDQGPVTERKWAALAALPVRTLFLKANTTLDRRGGELIAGMPSLESLFLYSLRLEPEALRAIGKAGRLNYLLLFHPRGAGPDLYAALETFGATTKVNVSDATLTDEGLDAFRKCVNLRHLSFSDAKITKAGVEKLAKALPQCQIVWEGGTIEPKKP